MRGPAWWPKRSNRDRATGPPQVQFWDRQCEAQTSKDPHGEHWKLRSFVGTSLAVQWLRI